MQICVRLFLSLLAAVIVGASGCAYSTRPLSDAKTSTADARLLGTWEIADTDKPAEKKIVVVDRKKDEPNVLRLFDIQEKKTADVFLTKIGERYVASIADEEDGKTKFLICSYEVKDQSLSIWGLDTQFITNAVNDKQLKGAVTKHDFFSEVIIDESAENLRKFVERNAASCFLQEKPLTVKRLRGE